jgi:DNA-binding HxlR family transcriptional regulator
MLKNTYDDQDCSVAGALELIGERWTILIIRDALLGLRRFDEFFTSLGVARTVLTHRLRGLVDNGILERVPYQNRPPRYEYLLTAKGRELVPVVISLMQWGDRHVVGPAGPSRKVEHASCGGEAVARMVCAGCGRLLCDREVVTRTYPGRPAAGHTHAKSIAAAELG